MDIIKGKLKSVETVDIIIILIIFLTILVIIIWLNSVMKLPEKNCKTLENVYKDVLPNVTNISKSRDGFNKSLFDYNIKTAYNCCCGGNFKNDFVDSDDGSSPYCALSNCIKQGARCLDFEVYSYNNKPIISVSSLDSKNIKETFNYLDFDNTMSWIANSAFSSGFCNTFTDPLLLNFRIMSNNIEIYPQIASSILNNFNDYLLESKYNAINYCKNIATLPLLNFINKVIIIVDNSTFQNLINLCPISHTQDCGTSSSDTSKENIDISNCQNPNLLEIINLHTNSNYLSMYRTSELKTISDTSTVINQNKLALCLLLPDISNKPTNISPALGINYGIQLIGMSFQNFDSNMEYYNLIFDKAGSSFILKSESLRYIQEYVELPDPLPTSIQVAPKTINLPLSIGDGLNIDFPKNPLDN